MSDAWDAYVAKFGYAPKDASQLQKYSKTPGCKELNFKEAKSTFEQRSKGGAAPSTGGGADAGAAGASGGGGGGLFAQLNVGLTATSGLKKVTDDMKTKNRKDKGTGKVPAAQPKSAPAAKKTEAKPKKPPSIAKRGPTLYVENHVEGAQELTQDCDLKTSIYILNCENCGFMIPNKVKGVVIDSCKNVQVEVSEVVSSVELVNSKKCKLFVKKTAPSITCDKCTAPGIMLFPEAFDKKPNIIISLTSEMNIEVPQKVDNDGNVEEWKEIPIAEQFTVTIDTETREASIVPLKHEG